MEQEFTLITCLSSSSSQGVWYIDGGAPFHVTGVREYFSSFKEEDIRFQIQMGNKSKYNLVARGTVLFWRENGKPIPIHDALHMPILGKNLICLSILKGMRYSLGG